MNGADNNYTSNPQSASQSNSRMKNIKKAKFQIWQQTFEARREDLVDMSLHHEERVKKINNVLNEEERNNATNKNYKDNLNVVGKEKKKRTTSILPEKVQNNINEARRINEELKRRVDEISKMNAMYVMKHGSKYINMTNGGDSKSTHTDLPKINEIKKFVEDFERDSSTKGPSNFKYINDNYRAQLMRAFLNFNPLIHLNNLRNLLEKADPAIRQDINNLWQTIERDLGEVLDPHYYKKKYLKIVADNKHSKEGRGTLSTDKEANSSSNNSLTNTKTNNIQNVPAAVHKMSIKNPNALKMINDKKKNVRKQNKDKYEIENVKEFIALIARMTNDKRLDAYIETAKNQPEEIQLDKHMGAYFKEMKAAEDVLKNMQSIKLKNTEQELKEVRNSVHKQNEDIINSIHNIRSTLIMDLLTDKK